MKEGIREGFLEIDKHMHKLAREDNWDRSGSTAASVLISSRHIYFINCGDSRTLLCHDGQVVFYTEDHKPFNPRERERIQNAGGSVTLQRVNGSLAVSRALGDFDFKEVDWRPQTEQLVSPEPEVYELERTPEDEFLILACDGVWDAIGNEELCAFVRSRMLVCNDLRDICTQVIDLCLYKVRKCPGIVCQNWHTMMLQTGRVSSKGCNRFGRVTILIPGTDVVVDGRVKLSYWGSESGEKGKVVPSGKVKFVCAREMPTHTRHPSQL